MYSDHIRRLARYDQWANHRVLEALNQLEPNASHTEIHLMGHILAATDVWLRRIDGLSLEGIQVFPHPTLEQCRAMFEHTSSALSHYCDGITDEDMEKVISYTNLKGMEFTTTLSDILTHLFNHGTYHRAQIATRLRQNGFTPAVTDYIAFVR
ncbi:MAG TPA: DinB family protein [Candidatus Kapabacteria bacterium]|nr:DinB family protein [Candidatus Kapabacteria bacterium]